MEVTNNIIAVICAACWVYNKDALKNPWILRYAIDANPQEVYSQYDTLSPTERQLYKVSGMHYYLQHFYRAICPSKLSDYFLNGIQQQYAGCETLLVVNLFKKYRKELVVFRRNHPLTSDVFVPPLTPVHLLTATDALLYSREMRGGISILEPLEESGVVSIDREPPHMKVSEIKFELVAMKVNVPSDDWIILSHE